MHTVAIELRKQHPKWGATYLQVQLKRLFPQANAQDFPCERTLQRWFAKAGFSAAPRGRRRSSAKERAGACHAVWQMDASEFLKLQSRKRVSWLRVVDEFTGAILWTQVFPMAKWERVPATETQTCLRKAFTKWGMPLAFRVDNGFPWGNSKDLPPDLALWLIGLGIEMHWIPPSCPQQNGVVERFQGVAQNWAEPQACQTYQELQERLDEADHIQREEYPFHEQQSRMAAFAALRHSGRRYTKKGEARMWKLQRVWDYLANFSWERRVSQTGQVSLYRQHYHVGRAHAGERIQVTFNPLEGEWLFHEQSGALVQKAVTQEMTKPKITKLLINPDRARKAGK